MLRVVRLFYASLESVHRPSDLLQEEGIEECCNSSQCRYMVRCSRYEFLKLRDKTFLFFSLPGRDAIVERSQYSTAAIDKFLRVSPFLCVRLYAAA